MGFKSKIKLDLIHFDPGLNLNNNVLVKHIVSIAMFIDRKEAGEQLALALEKYRNRQVLVLGIARGGAEIAYYVAHYLKAEMSLVITRKLGYPTNPEAAFGALAEDGSLYLSKLAKESISEEAIAQVMAQEKQVIERRIQKLRRGKPLPVLKDKIVIIADDGIATGATLFATIALCKKKKAARIVVAAPVSDQQIETILSKMVDEVIILEKPHFYYAVSQGYEHFHNLTDEEALAFMDTWEQEYHTA